MAKARKQITFDLDTDAMKKYYPVDSWNNGYDVIKRHMKNNGFLWLQGSTYASEKPMSHVRVQGILDELIRNNPWLNKCMRDCRESNIGKEHNLNYMFDKEAEVKMREEIKAEKEASADPFYSPENMAQLKRAMAQLEEDRVVSKTIEELEALEES